MFVSILLMPLLLMAPADDGLAHSGVSHRDLAKLSKDINKYFAALDVDDRGRKEESLGKIESSLGKALKKARADKPMTYYLGDWDVAFELAKPIARTFKSKAGRGFFKHVFVEPYERSRWAVLLSLPAGYDKAEDFLPVIVALKPALGLSGGELEEAVTTQATALYGDLLATHMVMVPLGPEQGEGRRAKATEIEGSWMSEEGLKTFFTSYRILLEQLRFDRSRVYLDGWQGTAGDALRLITSAPSFFAGVIARGGDLSAPGLILGNLFGLSLLYVQAGDADVSALDEGLDSVAVKIVEESGSLDAPSDTTRAAVVEWLGGLRKDLAPSRIEYRLGDIRFQNIHWCKAAKINKRASAQPGDPDFPRIGATIDRGSNTITFETVNVIEMEVYLSDALVDMSRPVTLVVNGARKWSKQPKASLRLMFDNRFNSDSGDYGLYTAVVRVEKIRANVPGSNG